MTASGGGPLDDFRGLSTKDGKLFFNGQEIAASVRLQGWALGAWVAALATLVGAIVAIGSQKDQFLQGVGLEAKPSKPIPVRIIEKHCTVILREEVVLHRVSRRLINLPCETTEVGAQGDGG